MLFRALTRLYGWGAPLRLVRALAERDYHVGHFLAWFWQSKTFYAQPQALAAREQLLTVVVALGMLLQIIAAVAVLVHWARFGTVGAWEWGLALLISYPLVWAHVLALGASIGWLVYFLVYPKKAGRAVVCAVLESQVHRLRRRHKFTVVAVAGSVGKTSTKLAIADLLAQTKRVRHQLGNYNDRVTVPLVFFDQPEPSLFNIFAWLKLFGANQAMLAHPYPYDVVVVELGTDGPGQLKRFAYLHPDITVVTAVSPEHMEYFKTLDAVATEELAVFEYSKRVLVNADDIAGKYLAGREFSEYSLESQQASYFAVAKSQNLQGQTLKVTTPTSGFEASVSYIGQQGAKFALAAAAVADMLGVAEKDIAQGLSALHHFAGRMQVLPGLNDSTLIDDTYNASPIAVKAALDVVYAAKAPQRIAILGSMNELGDYAQEAHEEVGAYCSAKKLDLVVTIGADAKKWLAPVAEKQGCTVKSFVSPYDAGAFVKAQLKAGAVVLAKGSQNGVFAEEALKTLLADSADTGKLVRQNPSWLKIKAKQFGKPFGFLPRA
jgi:UDP-N-acetylmuramyl pentapeptide synthase